MVRSVFLEVILAAGCRRDRDEKGGGIGLGPN